MGTQGTAALSRAGCAVGVKSETQPPRGLCFVLCGVTNAPLPMCYLMRPVNSGVIPLLASLRQNSMDFMTAVNIMKKNFLKKQWQPL